MTNLVKFIQAAQTADKNAKAVAKGGTALTIREIEIAAKAKFPKDSQMDQRFDERNRLRAIAGLPREVKERGGLAGVYDRNDHIIKPVLAAAAAIAVPATIGALVPSLAPVLRAAAPTPSAPTPPMLIAASGLGQAGGTLKTIAGGVLTGIATGAIDRIFGSGGGPPALPSFGPQGVPVPKEGIIGRTISRILPGGMTGREWTPVNDMTDRVGRPIAVHPATRESVVGPAGYVVVNYNGQRVAMLKHFAVRLGLYNPPPKPPVSGYDMRAIKRAVSAGKRVKKLAQQVGFRVEKKGSGRAAAKPAFARKRK